MPPRNLFLVLLASATCIANWTFAGRVIPGRRFNEVVALIEREHVAPARTDELVEAAITAAVGRLDEHSEYLRGERLEAVAASLGQEFVGVGLDLEPDPAGGEPVVVRPLRDSPAWQARVSPGTRVVAVNGVATRGRSLAEVAEALRGPRGSVVALRLGEPATASTTLDPTAAGSDSPADPARRGEREVVLVRDLVRMESVLGDRRRHDGSWEWRLADAPHVGLVRITGFGDRTAAEFRAALAGMSPAVDAPLPPLTALVIDLRENPGGLLAAAVEICDELLDAGLIVTTRSRSSGAAEPVRRAGKGAALPGVPIAVLVDGLTSSAAEIVAACLQDHRRAVVVGSRTFGKGTVQSILPLAGGREQLKLTTAEYLRPSGAPLHRRSDDGPAVPWGVSPDPGLEHAPTGAALERLAAWRRRRDAPPPHPEGPPPCAVDEVLRKAVDHLRGGGPAVATIVSEIAAAE